MKTVVLSCDSCHQEMRNASAAHTLFSGSQRRDFCTDACFGAWMRCHSGPSQTTFGVAANGLKCEQATEWDIWTVHGWNNDPEVRAQSFSTAAIPKATHQEWFKSHQENITMAWLPVGCARVEDGEISVVVDPAHRGKGFGSQLIKAASLPNTRARIKPTNVGSLAAFRNARYVEISRDDDVVEMVWPGLH